MPSEIKSPGGVSFELVWEQPSKDPSKVLNSPPAKEIDPEKIKQKLQAAEERRQAMLIESRKSQGQEKSEKIKRAQAKVAELETKFKEEAKLNLTEKLGKVEERKEASKCNLMLKLEKCKEQREKVQQRKKEHAEVGDNGDASTGPC